MADPKKNGKKDEKHVEEVHVIDVIRHGTQLVLPDDLDVEAAIRVLQRKQQQEEEMINTSERVMVFPWDGALALRKALEMHFGVALQNSGFFGARQFAVESGVNETVQVPWGSFSLPGIEGDVSCSADFFENRLVFEVRAEVKRKYEPVIKQLVALTRDIANRESIYRGKAFRMKFRLDDGQVDKKAQPKFMDLSNVEQVIFSDELQEEIDTNILAPILYSDAVRAAGTPLKRGALLAGKFGVGKTLLAANTAKAAVENDWTFLYCEDVREISDAVQFAQAYQPCVIFAEDADRATSGSRTTNMDTILNTLDGIGTKGSEIFVILTTNAVENINPAVLRPGRIDALLFVDPPDELAVTKLIRAYGRDLVAPGENLSEVGVLLRGRIPAEIREVVERAKLNTISRTSGIGGPITGKDLVAAAKTFIKAKERLAPTSSDADGNAAMRFFGEGFAKVFATTLAEYLQQQHSSASSVRPNGHAASESAHSA